MISILGKSVFYFFLALSFALFEVESEGKYGWASKSQTWIVPPDRFPWWLRRIFPKPLTGYHLFLFVGALLVTHIPFIAGVSWSVSLELQTIALYFTWTPLWDYLWFLFNPHYGVKMLGSRDIWWYRQSRWIGGKVPFENAGQWLLSLVFAYFGGMFWQHALLLGCLIVLTVVSLFTLVPLYYRLNHYMNGTK